ncbi:Calcineurin B-like protein 7 [Tritrichomonas foetus]|uniref:Calcineurin B-like protein 7 n=1 Tax=Tritrichomonas foetus TaxID=1144522 RepID=A0A1J4J981_9EUKA|nr:Calcineurin B-like protein 7 [Tritrichomonas foetus]|eukprot:OHS94243.1 Calcineurin B-like protein 7 [Tritrichomonas foetus]
MGAKGSKSKNSQKKLTQEDMLKLSKKTHFSLEQVQKIYRQFHSLSNSQIADNLIDIHEFQAALGLSSTEFTERIFAAFDSDGSSEIDFFEFVIGLSALSPAATLEEKATFCFAVYDIDKNGFIDKNELKEVLTFSLVGNASVHLSETQLEKIIEITFKKMDTNGDGEISLEEFTIEAKKNPAILSCVNLNLEGLLG